MPAAKTPKVTHDVTTLAGFLAAYDSEVARLNQKHQWCSAGYRYPYGYAVVDGEQVIAPPPRRSAAVEFETSLTDDDLTETGRAKLAAKRTGGLDLARKGAYAALKWALEGEHITKTDMTAVCKALGLAPLTRDTTLYGYMATKRGFRYATETAPAAEVLDAITAESGAAIRDIMARHGITPDDDYADELYSTTPSPSSTWDIPA
jgi:hypothetical protein